MINKDLLIDAPERRSVHCTEFELRSDGNTLRLEGYASVFDKPYEVNGGPNGNGWDEIVTRNAFQRTLSESPDVHLLINHDGLPLARTKSGTLRLGTDSTGLLVDADLDRRDPDVQGLEIKMARGDMDEMSFAFRVKKQSWSADDTVRSLDEISLHKGDVSVVNWGANPNTSAKILRNAVRMLANGDIDEEQLAELRAMSDEVDRAVDALRSTRTVIDLGAAKDGIFSAAEVRAVIDAGEPDDSPLAQAVHDLVANTDGVWCDPGNTPELPAEVPQAYSEKQDDTELRDVEAFARNLVQRKTISVADAALICRNPDAPKPLTIEEAEREVA